MKVNITGVGLIPRVGLLAPVFGKDLSKDTVSVILKYSSFKVYVAATGIRITRKNINQIFGESVQQSVARPVVEKVTASVEEFVNKPISGATVTEEKLEEAYNSYVKDAEIAPSKAVEIEKVSEPVVLDTVVEAPAIEETVEPVEVVADTTDAEIESSFVEDVEAVKDQLDETPAETTEEAVEEKPTYTNKKKKRR